MRSLLVIMALLCSNLAQAEVLPDTLRIAFLRGPSDLALAKEHGSLEKALAEWGVNVEWRGPFPAAAPAYEALNAGSVDLTTGSSTAFVTALGAGMPLTIFGYQQMPAKGEGIVVKQQSSIRRLEDLQGRRVAVNKGGTGEYLLSRALQTAGIAEDLVHKEYLSPSDTGSAFVGDHVDAWATWDPYLSLAQDRYDGRLLINGHELGSENAVGYFIHDRFQSYPQLVERILQVLRAENHWAREHPHAAGAIWARQMGHRGQAFAEQLGETNSVPLVPVGAAQIKSIRSIADWYVENGLIGSPPDIDQHVLQFGAAILE